MKFSHFDALIKEKYAISLRDYGGYYETTVISELHEWCDTNIGRQNYRANFSTFYFMTEEQRLMFTIKCMG